MKDISILLLNRLLEFDKLTSHVSDRIYPLILPEDIILPAITFQKVGVERFLAMDRPSGLTKSLFLINIWGKSYIQVREIQESLRLCLEGYRNMSSDIMINCISFQFESDDFDGYSNTENSIFSVASRWDIWHNEVQAF